MEIINAILSAMAQTSMISLLPSDIRKGFWITILVISLLNLVLGYRLRRFTCAFLGFLVGLLVGNVVVSFCTFNATVGMVLCVIFGAFFALLSGLVHRVGEVLISIGLGLITVYALAGVNDVIVVYAGLAIGIITGICTIVRERGAMILITSIYGGIWASYSFARVMKINNLFILVALIVVLAVLGILIQNATTRTAKERNSRSEDRYGDDFDDDYEADDDYGRKSRRSDSEDSSDTRRRKKSRRNSSGRSSSSGKKKSSGRKKSSKKRPEKDADSMSAYDYLNHDDRYDGESYDEIHSSDRRSSDPYRDGYIDESIAEPDPEQVAKNRRMRDEIDELGDEYDEFGSHGGFRKIDSETTSDGLDLDSDDVDDFSLDTDLDLDDLSDSDLDFDDIDEDK